MTSFFDNLFGKKQEPPRIQKCLGPMARETRESKDSEYYKKGDVIGGNYDVFGNG